MNNTTLPSPVPRHHGIWLPCMSQLVLICPSVLPLRCCTYVQSSYIRYESAASPFQLPIAASPCVASALAESVRG
ncbi:hypothetical protein V8C44DRAFT_336134 [Trichoderma aethiopicum]